MVYIFCVKKEAAYAAKTKENCLSPKHSDELFSFSGIAPLLAQKISTLIFCHFCIKAKVNRNKKVRQLEVEGRSVITPSLRHERSEIRSLGMEEFCLRLSTNSLRSFVLKGL